MILLYFHSIVLLAVFGECLNPMSKFYANFDLMVKVQMGDYLRQVSSNFPKIWNA